MEYIERPDLKDGPNYLALGVDTATVWDYHANLMPLVRDMELTKGVPVTSRYESRTGSPTKPPRRSIPCLCRASSTLGVGHNERVAPVLGRGIAGRRKYKGHWPSYEERKPLIDCDAHQNFGNLSALLQWVDPAHRDYLRHVGFGGFELPNYSIWSQPHGTVGNDSVPPDGEPPGSDYKTVRERLLDPLDVEYAVLTGEDILTISSLLNPQAAAAYVACRFCH